LLVLMEDHRDARARDYHNRPGMRKPAITYCSRDHHRAGAPTSLALESALERRSAWGLGYSGPCWRCC